MSVFPLEWNAVRSTCERTTSRVADLLKTSPDPEAKVPGLDWTVGELAAHLASLTFRYQPFVRSSEKAMYATMPEMNAQELVGFSDRSLAGMADLLEQGTASLLSVCKSGDSPACFFDMDSDCASAMALYSEELLVHGLDLSRAVGARWVITAEEALIAIAGALKVLPKFVDPEATRGFHPIYELRFRGGPTVAIAFGEGTATVSAGRAPRADCRISADPVAFLLTAFGRQSQAKSALTGKMIAFGRKPWLAFRFQKLLVSA